jgi:cell division septum initiation protein DivIVA
MISVVSMFDRGEVSGEPEFAIRMLGYARGEVDEFVAEVRRELRGLGTRMADEGGLGGVRVIGAPPPERPQSLGDHLSRLLCYAEEEARRRIAEAKAQAEQTLVSARELADQTAAEAKRLAEETAAEARGLAERLVSEARNRAAALEAEVTETLEREIGQRVAAMAGDHEQVVIQLTQLRDAMDAMLQADARRGPVESETFRDLVPRQPTITRLSG